MGKHGIDVGGSGRAELVCGVAFCATCAIRCHPQGRPPDLRRHRPESSYPRTALRLSRRSNANCTFSLPVGDAASGVAGNEGAVPGLQQCGDPGPASKSRTGTSRKPRTRARAAAPGLPETVAGLCPVHLAGRLGNVRIPPSLRRPTWPCTLIIKRRPSKVLLIFPPPL